MHWTIGWVRRGHERMHMHQYFRSIISSGVMQESVHRGNNIRWCSSRTTRTMEAFLPVAGTCRPWRHSRLGKEARNDSIRGESPSVVLALLCGLLLLRDQHHLYQRPLPYTLPTRIHIPQNAGWSFLRRACAPVHAHRPFPADLQARIRELHQLGRAFKDMRGAQQELVEGYLEHGTDWRAIVNCPDQIRLLQPGRHFPWQERQRRQLHCFPDRGRRYWP
jgi:hypothetical protein